MSAFTLCLRVLFDIYFVVPVPVLRARFSFVVVACVHACASQQILISMHAR